MSGPIIQIPYLRPDPVHELPGALGSMGGDLFRLAQMMQQRQEAQGRLGIQQQNVEELRGLRSAEEQKNALQARGLQQEQDARTKMREDRDAALNKITDPDLRAKLAFSLNLGDLPADVRRRVAEQTFGVHQVDPGQMTLFSSLIAHQMPLGMAADMAGMQVPEGMDRKWKAPPPPSVLLREDQIAFNKLNKDAANVQRQIEQVDRQLKAHEDSVRKANPPPLGGFPNPDDAIQYENRIRNMVNQSMRSLLQNREELRQRQRELRDRIHIQSGFMGQAQAQTVNEDRLNQLMDLYNRSSQGGNVGPAPAAADTSSTR